MNRYLLISILITLALILLPKLFFKPSLTIDMCDKISSADLRITCYAMFLKEYKYCLLAGTFYTFCVDFVHASSLINQSFCNSLSGYNKISCMSNLAIKTKDPSICDSLNNSEIYSCYYFISSYLDYLKPDEDFCKKINEESLRSTCLAKLNKNTNYCENIVQEPFEKWNCLGMVSGSIEYCEKSDNFNYCLLLVALETKDTKLCEKIEAKGIKINCLLRLKKDLSSCNEFEETWKDYCILNYLALKDLGLI